jgi:hypothetical protein
MASHGYHRASLDTLLGLAKRLSEEEPWKAIETAPYEAAADQLSTPVLSLLKMRLAKKHAALVAAVGTASNALTLLDVRWDSAQRKLKRAIEGGEEDADANIKAAAGRLRAVMLLGQGSGQTQLSFREEVTFGERQVALARAPKAPGATTPTISEDLTLLGVLALIDDIELRTRELAEELKRVPEEQATSRHARIRVATAGVVDALNAAHDELEEQIAAARSPETQDRLRKHLAVLVALLPAAPPAPAPTA